MPIQYSINRSLALIEERWTDTITIQTLKEYWLHYLADTEVMHIRKTLVDLRMANIKFIGRELDSLIRSDVVPRLKGLTWKTAIVVERPVQYGVSRQYQVFAELYSNDSIFYDYEKAIEWLLKQ
jgi:hypothetical protein